MRRVTPITAAIVLSANLVAAQEIELVKPADGAVLRGLDTITKRLTEFEIMAGETKIYERLSIRLSECRYPADNPASDAFAHLEIRERRDDSLRFEGWMVASSPALSAMDHPRYDVWVIRCIMPDGVAASGG